VRSIDAHFDKPSLVEQVGNGVLKLLSDDPRLSAWAEGRIYKTAAFSVADGMPSPSILVSTISAAPEFHPSGKERNAVRVGILVTIEEPHEILDPEARTIATVEDHLRGVLLSDPTLLVGGKRGRGVRLHRFELSSFDGRADDDRTTFWFAFVAAYWADIDAFSRNRFAAE
jgi:hypothetical protein